LKSTTNLQPKDLLDVKNNGEQALGTCELNGGGTLRV
jgi:hypothetical protein